MFIRAPLLDLVVSSFAPRGGHEIPEAGSVVVAALAALRERRRRAVAATPARARAIGGAQRWPAGTSSGAHELRSAPGALHKIAPGLSHAASGVPPLDSGSSESWGDAMSAYLWSWRCTGLHGDAFVAPSLSSWITTMFVFKGVRCVSGCP